MLKNRILKQNQYQIILWFLLLLAFVLRIYGIDSYRSPDESYEVNRALNALNGEFDWSRNLKGGLYILLIPIYAIAKIFTNDYHTFIVLGRCVQGLIGLGIIYTIYRCLLTEYATSITLLFLLPPILSSKLISSAHIINVQNLMFLGILVHVYLVLTFFKTKQNKYFYYSLIPLSIAVSSQATAVITLFPLAILFIIVLKNNSGQNRIKFIKGLMIYVVLSLGIYLVFTPGIIISFKQNIALLLNFMGFTNLSISKESPLPAFFLDMNKNIWIEYLAYMKNYFGSIQLLLIICSTIMIFIKKKWSLLYPLGIFLAFFLVLINAPNYMYEGRYLIPGLIMGYLIMPFAFNTGKKFLINKKHIYKKIYIILTGILVIFFIRTGYHTINKVLQFGLPDTRVLMSKWLELNTKCSDKILLENTQNFPVVPCKEQAVYVEHWNNYPLLGSINANYIVINKESYQYLINKNMNANYISFYRTLSYSNDWEFIHKVMPENGKITGPELEIYYYTYNQTD